MSEWIIICNANDYDVDGAFNQFDIIEWKQSTSIEEKDIIYIYVGAPYSAIKYRCEVLATELKEVTIDDSEFVIDDKNYGNYGRYMRLRLLNKYEDNPKLGYMHLRENGLNTVQGPSKVAAKLSTYLLTVTEGSVVASEDSELLSLLSEKSEEVILNKIKQFTKRLSLLLPEEQQLEKLRQKFVDDYNMNALVNMTKEEYVVGLGSKTSFCYRLETELQGLGNIHGSTSNKFGLYYGKSGEDVEDKFRWTKKYGNNADEALEEIKKQIIYLRMAGKKKDLEAIRESELAPMFRGKILSVFFPEEYLCIFSDEHLDYFLNKLKLYVTPNDDIIDKQVRLVEWKKTHVEMKKWTNHIFSRFLYFSFGRPLEMSTKLSIQKERDADYPRDYVSKVNITIEQWKDLLTDPKVFRREDIELLKRFYLADNHATTCYDLSIQDGVSPTSYITPVVALAKRVMGKMQLSEIVVDDGSTVWWRVPFWGRYREDGRFEWKLRPKLAKAMELLYPELTVSADLEAEDREDNYLIEELKFAKVDHALGFQYLGEPKEKVVPVYTHGHKIYPRDRRIAINALAHAEFTCEIDKEHPTFIRKNSNKNYTEPHHLVPMAFSEKFKVSLDVEENIVSLCSNCHNQIHYGKEANVLIEKLYQERYEVLISVGIEITLEELLTMYGYGG